MTPIEDDGEVEISDKMLEDTEISRDSGLGDISENIGLGRRSSVWASFLSTVNISISKLSILILQLKIAPRPV